MHSLICRNKYSLQIFPFSSRSPNTTTATQSTMVTSVCCVVTHKPLLLQGAFSRRRRSPQENAGSRSELNRRHLAAQALGYICIFLHLFFFFFCTVMKRFDLKMHVKPVAWRSAGSWKEPENEFCNIMSFKGTALNALNGSFLGLVLN